MRTLAAHLEVEDEEGPSSEALQITLKVINLTSLTRS